MVNPGTIIKLENCLRGMPLLACIQKFRDPHSSFQEKFDVTTGADLWVALLELYKLLKAQDVSNDIKLLLETGVRISELLYAGEEVTEVGRSFKTLWLMF